VGMRTSRSLDVRQKAMRLVEETYRVARLLPDHERFGLIRQLQRAAVSIPTNIAEGYGRTHRGDYLHHLSIARGSLMEWETLLTLSVRRKPVDRARVLDGWQFSQDVGRMLTKLIASLRRTETLNPNPETRRACIGSQGG